MDFVSAYEIMKNGGTVFKRSNPNELYTANFNNKVKKYTICVNGKALDKNADWESIFICNEWEVASKSDE